MDHPSSNLGHRPHPPLRASLKLAQAGALVRVLAVLPAIAAIWVVLILLVHA